MANAPQTAEPYSSARAYWCMSFAGVPASIPEVRRYLVSVLGKTCGIEPLLVATELATNAIKHTASGSVGGQFALHVDRHRNQLEIRVDDQGGPRTPHLLTQDVTRDTGRGLALVARLSMKWGVRGNEQSRTVWADLELPSDQPEGSHHRLGLPSANERGGIPP